jgi:hypothetical protein
MSLKKTKEVEVEKVVEGTTLTGRTFVIVPEGAGFTVLKVKFDPSQAEVFRKCATRDEAVEAFKIEIAKTGMLG